MTRELKARYAYRLLAAIILSITIFSVPTLGKTYSGIPHYRFYTEQDLRSASRALFLEQATNGTIFLGTETGLLQFDGLSWNQVFVSEDGRGQLGSIYFDQDQVFSGLYQYAGKLLIDPENKIVFSSLNEKPFGKELSEFFGKILPWGKDRIIFLGTRSVAVFDKRDGTFKFQSLGKWSKHAFVCDDILHLSTPEGIYVFNSEGNLESSSIFSEFNREKTIEATAELPNGDLLIGTISRGVFLKSKDGISPSVYTELEQYSQHPLTDLKLMPDNRLIAVLSGLGLLIFNPDGSVSERLDGNVDFRFRDARTVLLDKNGSLWIMFTATVAKVILDAPLTEIDQRLRPSLYYPKLHYLDGDLLLHSNSQLLKAQFDASNRLSGFAPAFKEHSKHVITAATGPDGLYIRSKDTIGLFRNGESKHLGAGESVDAMIVPKNDASRLVTITPTHINLMQRAGDRLIQIDQTTNPSGYPYHIAGEASGDLWVENGMDVVTRITIKENKIHAKKYGPKSGLPLGWITLWAHNDEVLFSTGEHVLKYNAGRDRFVENDILDSLFPREGRAIHRAATDPNGNIWISINQSNKILWKQTSENYQIDHDSLASLGKSYFHKILFPTEKETFIATAHQLFNLNIDLATTAKDPPDTRIISIRNPDKAAFYYQSLDKENPKPLKLSYDSNNILFRISNSYSRSLSGHQYRYFLHGLSQDWSEWSNTSELHFTNLDHGEYAIDIETRLGNGKFLSPISYSFEIKPSLFRTPWAYICYLIGALTLIAAIIQITSRKLKSQNTKLEQMVNERTQEIEHKSHALEEQATLLEAKNAQLATAFDELHNTQDKLLSTARKAGMAEVATNVLHNVGNVLNSINIGVSNLSLKLSHSRIGRLEKVASLLHQNKDQLPTFLSESPQGRAVPDYLEQLAKVMGDEFQSLISEVDGLSSNIDHVKRVISTQQAHAKTVDIIQPIDLRELIEAATQMVIEDSEKHAYRVERDLDPELIIESDKHKILQMLTNFVKNAKESIQQSNVEVGRIAFIGRFSSDRKSITLTISDNGVGIEADALEKIFTHGFTTKFDGHGFGMHSCANTIKSLGGELQIDSEGLGQGAKVTLTLPQSASINKAEEAAVL